MTVLRIVNDGKLIDKTFGVPFKRSDRPQVVNVGDVMYDAALIFGRMAKKKSAILENLSLNPGEYFLLTMHRAENTDDICRLQGILSGIRVLAEEMKVVFPIQKSWKQACNIFCPKCRIWSVWSRCRFWIW